MLTLPPASSLACRPGRRKLLLGAAAAVASAHWRVARAQDQPPRTARLVVVLLRGAMDGLSLVAPHGEAAYYAARPTIAVPRPGEPDGLLPIDRLHGMHPAFAPLLPYWTGRQLAFVHASGSPDPTRSHFDAQDYLESATPGRKTTPDGWLNRLAATLADDPRTTPQDRRLLAVNLGPTLPRIFAGPATVASLASGNAAVSRGALDRERFGTAFNQLYGGDDAMSQAVREASATRRAIMDSLASDDPKADQGALALNGLPRDLARLGQLMARDARIRLAFAPVGGWDTHANQGNGRGQLANRFAVLADALGALARGLGPRLEETTVLVLSEFGRTVAQNGTGGTDHGHGNLAFALGGAVNGGQVLGRWPGLDASALYEGRDLAITTDFRDLIADVLELHFRVSDRQLAFVLPDMGPRARVGLIRA